LRFQLFLVKRMYGLIYSLRNVVVRDLTVPRPPKETVRLHIRSQDSPHIAGDDTATAYFRFPLRPELQFATDTVYLKFSDKFPSKWNREFPNRSMDLTQRIRDYSKKNMEVRLYGKAATITWLSSGLGYLNQSAPVNWRILVEINYLPSKGHSKCHW